METRTMGDRTPARIWLMILGFTLLLLAVLGLFAPVVDMLHNLRLNIEAGEDAVHWVLAIATLGLAYGVKDDRLLAQLTIGYGVVYLLVGVFGFIVPEVGFWHVQVTDNILHLVLGAVTIGAGMASRRDDARVMTRRTTS